MNRCDICQEEGINDCKNCKFGNPCYGCDDYDIENNSCKSKGACANVRGEAIQTWNTVMGAGKDKIAITKRGKDIK